MTVLITNISQTKIYRHILEVSFVFISFKMLFSVIKPPQLLCLRRMMSSQKFDFDKTKGNIVVEFSSPNIAKPFHVGHLRSAIIGNFISNLLKFRGFNVTRLNYIGDWGTQFGYLKVGVDMKGYTDAEMEEKPIENLYHAYIEANKLAELNPSISEKARLVFQQMEFGEFEELDKWNKYRQYTVNELKTVYNRLGVEFDMYDWESLYNRKVIDKVLKKMEDKNLISKDEQERLVVSVNDKKVPIVKSDGTTLYLTRDIAAILDRTKRFNFQKMIYVVDNSQANHFLSLFGVAKQLNNSYDQSLIHIKFGRIKGMSTRKGTAVFLNDILNEARDIMLQKQVESPTTKIDLINLGDKTADILGISAVIINDLKQRRQRDYEFDWDRILQVNGDTGIKLQYTHCRLASLLELQGESIASLTDDDIMNYTDFSLLNEEQDALNLIRQINKFETVIDNSIESLEAYVLVTYLFGLCNWTSKALKRLNVKNEIDEKTKQQKLMLFRKSKIVLNQGMKILGLKPLKKM